MGCCVARPEAAEALQPVVPHHPGSPSQDAPIADHPDPSSSAGNQRSDRLPLSQHINKPLRRHLWTSKDIQWTRRALKEERAIFFETTVTGRSEMWQTIHVALQVLWDPSSIEARRDGRGGLATAQSILTAAGISLPTGDLADGAYDMWGNYYKLPPWVVSDPGNVIEDDEGQADDDAAAAAAAATILDGEDNLLAATVVKGEACGRDDVDTNPDQLSADEADRRREEKGKAVLGSPITLRARLSETGRDIKVSIYDSDSVRSITRAITSEAALPSSKKIRLAYMGKMLRENATLGVQGWKSGHILNALVFPQ